jgi:3-methyladenine DNA glycosylase AlkD
MTANDARQALRQLASAEVAASAARFFKTGPGQYGEGDVFIGVRVPALRKLAREHRGLPLAEVESLLASPIHEERLLALLVLVGSVARCDETWRKTVFDLYLRSTHRVNNWDLVDTSAPTLVGGYLADKPRSPLVALAKSASLWERRIAIIATQHFIRRDEFADTLALARLLLADPEDLIHKATGWMLREVGDRDEPALEAFLREHAPAMPRTMLRYAIEKLPDDKRKDYLAAKRPGKK